MNVKNLIQEELDKTMILQILNNIYTIMLYNIGVTKERWTFSL